MFRTSTVRNALPALPTALLLAGLACGTAAQAQQSGEYALPIAESADADGETAYSFSSLLRDVLLEALRDDFVDEKNWGRTVERWDGLQTRGLRISKRTKTVNHGLWRRYRVSLIRPDETLRVRFEQLPPRADGSIPLSVRVSLKARVEATAAVWNYGVKGWNGTSVSDAKLTMRLLLSVSPQVEFSWSSLLPRVDLRPRVEDVRLSLDDLDLKRVGVFEGKAVELVGDGARSVVQDMIRQRESRIRKTLQRKLASEQPERGDR